VQIAMSDSDAQRKSLLSDCTWLENEYGSFNFEALKFVMHFRELGSSLYFIFTQLIFFSHTYNFYFFLFLCIFFFLSFSFSFFSFLSQFFLISSPFEL
jgi:hypothetical protein